MTGVAAVATVLAVVAADTSEQAELTERNPHAAVVDASDHVVFGMRWKRRIVRSGFHREVIESFGSPAISERNHVVIVGQGEGELRALRLGDGTEVWRYEHGIPFETAITLLPENERAPEIAVATSRDGAVLAVDVETGELRWRGQVTGNVRARGVRMGDDLLLLTTTQNRLFAVDVADGTVRWSAGRPPPSSLTVEGHSAATVHNGVIYAAFADGYVEAYRSDDGSSIWSRPLSFVGGEFVDADADPQVADGRLYVASYSDGIYALDLADGKTIWQRPAPSVTTLALYDDDRQHFVIAGSADGFLWGLEREGGALAYRVRLPSGPMSRLTVRRGFAVAAAGTAGLVVLNAVTGRPLQSTAVNGWLGFDAAWYGKYLAALSSQGELYLFTFGDAGLVD